MNNNIAADNNSCNDYHMSNIYYLGDEGYYHYNSDDGRAREGDHINAGYYNYKYGNCGYGYYEDHYESCYKAYDGNDCREDYGGEYYVKNYTNEDGVHFSPEDEEIWNDGAKYQHPTEELNMAINRGEEMARILERPVEIDHSGCPYVTISNSNGAERRRVNSTAR